MSNNKLKFGVSACLLGFKYRYDGTADKWQELIDKLKDVADFVPVCPEVESGLPVPRPKMHIRPSSKGTRLVVVDTGEDLTDMMMQWAEVKLEQLELRQLDGFIFHSKSPCCGYCTTKLRTPQGRILTDKASGLFAAAFHRKFPKIPIGDERDLDAFLKKITVMTESEVDV